MEASLRELTRSERASGENFLGLFFGACSFFDFCSALTTPAAPPEQSPRRGRDGGDTRPICRDRHLSCRWIAAPAFLALRPGHGAPQPLKVPPWRRIFCSPGSVQQAAQTYSRLGYAAGCSRVASNRGAGLYCAPAPCASDLVLIDRPVLPVCINSVPALVRSRRLGRVLSIINRLSPCLSCRQVA